MSNFYAKDSLAMDRQLKVQKLTIPFTITASATPASVVITSDEPSILFFQTEGVNQITAAKASSEVATYTTSPVDANGTVNIFVKVGEAVAKIMYANAYDRANGGSQPVKLGSASGLSSLSNMMLTLDSSQDFSSTNADYCLVVEYVVVDGN